MTNLLLTIFFIVALVANADVYAYLDLGGGGMLLNLILGAITAGGLALKMYWRRLRGLFGRSTRACRS